MTKEQSIEEILSESLFRFQMFHGKRPRIFVLSSDRIHKFKKEISDYTDGIPVIDKVMITDIIEDAKLLLKRLKDRRDEGDWLMSRSDINFFEFAQDELPAIIETLDRIFFAFRHIPDKYKKIFDYRYTVYDINNILFFQNDLNLGCANYNKDFKSYRTRCILPDGVPPKILGCGYILSEGSCEKSTIWIELNMPSGGCYRCSQMFILNKERK